MSSSKKEVEEPTSTIVEVPIVTEENGKESIASEAPRPPAKRSAAVIEISDTDSDDSDICAVTSYVATADEVKRIRGDYTSSSSSSDYSSDSESPWEDDSILLNDERSSRKVAVQAQLNPRANRMDDPKLNPALKTQDLIEKLQTHWKEQKSISNDTITLSCEPFRLCLLHDLLDNPNFVNNIIDDMNTLDWNRKKMDLYEFHQTADLASLTWQRSIRGIYDLLKTEMISWVSQVTGLELTSVSASCSLYGPGDHLLVHDDLLGDRRIAFILYLAPWVPCDASYRQSAENGGGDNGVIKLDDYDEKGWAPHMGGALELLEKDDNGHPTKVVHKVYPSNNMMAFFKVGTDSFHQVGEVLSLELPRLSINGWFHGPLPPDEPNAPPDPPPAEIDKKKAHTEVVLINEWLEETYMLPRSRAQIQTQMEQESEVCLRDLLQPTKYDELLAALRQPDLPWELCGPGHQRHYQRVPTSWLESLDNEHVIKSLFQLITSFVWFRLLIDCTDLKLTTYDSIELQRWTPGDFTLLPPRDQYQDSRLEATMYFGVPKRPFCGGTTSYVAPEENGTDCALVTLTPKDNALNLVFCDAGSVSFTKYLSKMTMSDYEHFYILKCTYRE